MSVNLQHEPWITAKLLLNNNQYSHASLSHVSDFSGFKLGVDTKNSWCDYRLSRTTIYLKPEAYPNEVTNQIAVACHEVGHALNYRAGQTDISKLQFYTKANIFLFLPLWINGAWSSWLFDRSLTLGIISIIVAIVLILFMNPYHEIYKRDEVNAWIKGKEIYEELIRQNCVLQSVADQKKILDYIEIRTTKSNEINGRWLIFIGVLIYPLSFLINHLIS